MKMDKACMTLYLPFLLWMRQRLNITNLNTTIIKMIKEEFHFTISIVNNMLLVMVKEDSCGPLRKTELLLLIFLQIRA